MGTNLKLNWIEVVVEAYYTDDDRKIPHSDASTMLSTL